MIVFKSWFVKGSCDSSGKALATGSTARIRSRVLEGWRFFSLLRIQTAPGVHSAYYNMSTGGKGGRA